VQRWPWERSRRGKLLLRCVCSAAREALGRPRGEERGWGILCRHAHSLLIKASLTRDAMRKLGLCSLQVSVRLSVCLPVWFVYCIQTAEVIVTLLSLQLIHHFRFLSPSAAYWIPMGTFSAEALNTQGVGNICSFRLNLPFISETVRDRPHDCHGTLIGNHKRRIDPYQFRWPWVTLKGETQGLKFF